MAGESSQRHLHARILLVEDNPVNLLVAQRLLGVLGLDCDTATNGEAALLRMHDGNYDLVLIDCQMPILDGYTATRRWREYEAADPNEPHLPIIAMTANAMTGDRQRCLDAGMDDYLAKPVTRGQLENCLHRWLAGGRVRGSRAGVGARQADPASIGKGAPGDGAANERNAVENSAVESMSIERNPFDSTPNDSTPIDGASAQGSATPVLDDETLEELYAVIGAETARIINVYLEDAPQLVAQLEQAALGPDFDALRDAAHSLKSSSANLGAMALSAAAKRIELGARMQSLDRPAVAVALVVAEFERARVALQAHLQDVRA